MAARTHVRKHTRVQHTHRRTQNTDLTHTHTHINVDYRPGLSPRYGVPWQNFMPSFPRVNIALRELIVVPALQYEISGCPRGEWINRTIARWQRFGSKFRDVVMTSLLRPITHARRGRFSRALKDEKEHVTERACRYMSRSRKSIWIFQGTNPGGDLQRSRFYINAGCYGI